MKYKNKLLSLCIIVTIIFTSVPVNASASVQNNEQNYQIKEDNEERKIVISEAENGVYEFDYNKITNEITFSIYTYTNGELISRATVDIDDYPSYDIQSNVNARSTTNQNTFSNWEYTVMHGSPTIYELRRPDGSLNGTYYFTTRMQEGYNKENITSFMAAVESINTIEGSIIASLGLSAVLAGIAMALVAVSGGVTAAFWGPYIASLTADSAVVALGFELDSACSRASYHYWETRIF